METQQQTEQMPPLPGVMDLVHEMFGIFKSRFKLYLPFYTIMFVGTVLYGFMAQIANTEPFNAPMYWLLLFVYVACNFYATIALILNLADANLHIDEVYRRTNQKLLPYLGTTFLSGLIIAGGFLLLIIPGIFFSFWFFLAPYIILLENTGVRGALSKSKAYMQGEGWHLYFKGFLATLIPSLPLIVASMFIGATAEAIGLQQTLIGRLGVISLTSALSVIGAAINVITMYLIYSYTRKRTLQAAAQLTASAPVVPQTTTAA